MRRGGPLDLSILGELALDLLGWLWGLINSLLEWLADVVSSLVARLRGAKAATRDPGGE